TTIGYYAFPNFEYITEIYIPYTVIRCDGPIWGATIYGYTGSYAEEYFANYGNEFVSLGEIPEGAFLVDVDYGENHHWTLDVKGVLTISGTGEMPEEDSQYSYPWSDLMDSVKEVVIEDGVTTVSSNAFYEFENIRKVTTKGNMDYIGDNAFYGCTSLEEVDLSVIDTFKYGAFNGCYSLKNVDIPKGAKTIENYAFANSESLEYVLVPYSVETIENYAFSYNSSGFTVKGYKGSEAEKHTKRVYPNLNFESLGMIPLDEEVRGTIGDNITWTLSTDGTFVMSGEGEMLPECGYNSGPWYNYKDYVKKVIITDGITSVCRYAFYNHTQLSSVSLPDSLVFIDAQAFSGCEKLLEVTVPASVLGMNGAFDDYRENFTIKGYTNSAAEKYAIKYGIDFESIGVMEKEIIDSGSCGENLTWTFDNSCVLKISGSGEMSDYQENTVPWRKYASVIAEVDFSDGITHIGNNSFSFCEALFEVEFPSKLESIGSYAFMGSYNIRGFEIPKTVKHIGAYAFYETYYPIFVYGNPETIGNEAFGFTRVYSQKGGSCEEFCQTSDARFYSLTDSGKLGDNVTWDVDVTTGVLNITGTGEIYDYKLSWRNTSSSDYVEGSAPFYDGYGDLVSEVNISEGITRIGDNALYGLSVREITFPSTLESIGEYGFSCCGFSETEGGNEGFEKIIIPESVVDIEAYAFEYTSVKKLYISENTQIGRFAFEGTDATIYSSSGSPAHAYAEDYGMPFVDINIKPTVAIGNVVCNPNQVVVTLGGENLEMGSVFVALYGENGKLLDAENVDSLQTVELHGADYNMVKVFLWDENMKPLCGGDSREVKYKRPSSGGGGGGSSSAGGTASGTGGSSSSSTGGTVSGDVFTEAE
ncbi:MAG: leucine-rich repeat domain-containing protein, partial [Clostridia bacterium]|nr:leucine-rich repeat domain-containing protein [Clostridia bacterium]